MRRAGIFVDSSNTYYCLKKKYNRKLSYEKYREFFAGLYSIEACYAYAAVNDNSSMGFIKAVEKAGYVVQTKQVKEYEGNRRKCDMDVNMTIDMVNLSSRLDVVILGTADGDMSPLVDWLLARSIQVIPFACGLSSELLKRCPHALEISESVLE